MATYVTHNRRIKLNSRPSPAFVILGENMKILKKALYGTANIIVALLIAAAAIGGALGYVWICIKIISLFSFPVNILIAIILVILSIFITELVTILMMNKQKE